MARIRRRHASFAVLGATLAALAVGGIGVVSASAGEEPPNQTVTLCHATGSTTNPYVEITVDENAIANVILGHGHATHTGPIFPDTQQGPGNSTFWGDIIPAFNIPPNSFNGLNNTTQGLAILANHCEIPTPPTTAPPVTTAPPGAAVPAAPAAAAAVVVVPRVTG